MISSPTELRFFDTKQMNEERKMVYGYFQDAIRSYGKDVKYYKMDNVITNDGNENSELGYGFDPHKSVAKVATLRTYIKFDSYSFQFNQFGFEPKSELVFFFSLNDFAVNFIGDFGKFRKFDVRKEHKNVPYNGEDRIRIPFTCDITSGIVEFVIPENYNGCFLDGQIVEMYEPIYQILSNPYTHKTYTSDYHGNYFTPSIRARFYYGKVTGMDYDIEGSILYSGYDEARAMSDIIRPNIADVIEVPYDTEDGHVEQYEISQVLDRLPTVGNSISYLMGRYVWQCHAVRRVASSGDSVEITEEAQHAQDNISTYSENREKMNRQNNYDWKQNDDDNHVYGCYDSDPKMDLRGDRSNLTNDEDAAEDAKVTSKEVLVPETKEGWKVLIRFADDTMVTTDGYKLFFEFRNTIRSLITGFKVEEDYSFKHEYKDRAYLFNINGNLCFVDDDKKVTRITSFDGELPHVDDNPVGAFYEDDVAEMQDNWYIFNKSKMAIYSKNRELVCVSKDGEEEVISTL